MFSFQGLPGRACLQDGHHASGTTQPRALGSRCMPCLLSSALRAGSSLLHTAKIFLSRAEVTGEGYWPDREMARRVFSSLCHLCLYANRVYSVAELPRNCFFMSQKVYFAQCLY